MPIFAFFYYCLYILTGWHSVLESSIQNKHIGHIIHLTNICLHFITQHTSARLNCWNLQGFSLFWLPIQTCLLQLKSWDCMLTIKSRDNQPFLWGLSAKTCIYVTIIENRIQITTLMQVDIQDLKTDFRRLTLRRVSTKSFCVFEIAYLYQPSACNTRAPQGDFFRFYRLPLPLLFHPAKENKLKWSTPTVINNRIQNVLLTRGGESMCCCHIEAAGVQFTVPNAALTILALHYQPFPSSDISEPEWVTLWVSSQRFSDFYNRVFLMFPSWKALSWYTHWIPAANCLTLMSVCVSLTSTAYCQWESTSSLSSI